MRLKKYCLIFLAALLLVLPLASCIEAASEENERPAAYGDKARLFAIELAQNFPFRSAGSEEERRAGEFIAENFRKLGHLTEMHEFVYIDDEGYDCSSQNIVVKVEGTGFIQEEEEAAIKLKDDSEGPALKIIDDRFIVVGASYDTPVSEEEAEQSLRRLRDIKEGAGREREPEPEDEDKDKDEENAEDKVQDERDEAYGEDEELSRVLDFSDYDGLHDNAAGVGVLYQLLIQLSERPPAYDVYIVAFGASGEGHYGAENFLYEIEDKIDRCDCMYNINSIYAGNKVYAHAGQNSVINLQNKDYSKRRKLYEVTDVYYFNLLLTRNDFAIYTNQSVYRVNKPGYEEHPVEFREWTTHLGDHTPFDEAGIPIVFFESYEYDVDKYEELTRESTDPAFAAYGGVIKGRAADSSTFLLNHFRAEQQGAIKKREAEDSEEKAERPVDLLERRINNLAFILTEVADKGPQGYVPDR